MPKTRININHFYISYFFTLHYLHNFLPPKQLDQVW